MGLVLKAPGLTVEGYFPESEPGWGGLTVLPKAGLQRAADLLLGAKMHNSQILRESASSLFTLHNVEAVQNWAAFASRDDFMARLLDHLLWPPQPYLAVRARVTSLGAAVNSSLYLNQCFLGVVLSF